MEMIKMTVIEQDRKEYTLVMRSDFELYPGEGYIKIIYRQEDGSEMMMRLESVRSMRTEIIS